jgi:hypothetical protein
MDLGNAAGTRGSNSHHSVGENSAKATIMLHAPNGQAYTLKRQALGNRPACLDHQNDNLVENGDEHIGAAFFAWQPGVYIADARRVTDDNESGKAIKCAKAIIGVAGRAGMENGLTGFERAVSQVLEVVPLNDPTNLTIGDSLIVQVWFKGHPLPFVCLTVLPRGKVLPRLGVENPYDLLTDAEGKVQVTFEEANYHLLVVHLEMEEGFSIGGGTCQKLHYTGDLTVLVRSRLLEPSRASIAHEALEETPLPVPSWQSAPIASQFFLEARLH